MSTFIKNDEGCRNLIRAILTTGMDPNGYSFGDEPDIPFMHSQWFEFLLGVYLDKYNYTSNDIRKAVFENLNETGRAFKRGYYDFYIREETPKPVRIKRK